jgi:hypothetical protein
LSSDGIKLDPRQFATILEYFLASADARNWTLENKISKSDKFVQFEVDIFVQFEVDIFVQFKVDIFVQFKVDKFVHFRNQFL